MPHGQCWAKFVASTGNFPASHEPNRNFKILAGHVPTNDNVNRNMLKTTDTNEIHTSMQ